MAERMGLEPLMAGTALIAAFCSVLVEKPPRRPAA